MIQVELLRKCEKVDRKCTLMSGVVTGIAMIALQPSLLADSATPWAWFPADEHMTPLSSCSFVSLAIMLYAPLSLNENTYNQ